MKPQKRTISLDHPTTPGLTPLEVIALGHALECDAVSLRMTTHPSYPQHQYDLVNDRGMRMRVRGEVANRGMFLALGSGFVINPGTIVENMQPALDALGEMEARALSVVIYDQDKASHQDRLGELAERSGRLGVRTLVEYFALSGADSLEYTVGLVQKIGGPWIGISADSLHFTRTGTSLEQLASVPFGLIGHAQVNDGPAHMPRELQMDEARGGRLLPGEGEFDLIGFLQALPADVTIGIEAGSKSRFAQGVSMQAHAKEAVAATRRLMAEAFASYRN